MLQRAFSNKRGGYLKRKSLELKKKFDSIEYDEEEDSSSSDDSDQVKFKIPNFDIAQDSPLLKKLKTKLYSPQKRNFKPKATQEYAYFDILKHFKIS